jgi:hypothetical protein
MSDERCSSLAARTILRSQQRITGLNGFNPIKNPYNPCNPLLALAQSIGTGSARQICSAYSRMVRSLEKGPEQATLTTALRVQAWGSA